jgi:hypothetical protein
MRGPAYEPSPQVKPVMHSLSDLKHPAQVLTWIDDGVTADDAAGLCEELSQLLGYLCPACECGRRGT